MEGFILQYIEFGQMHIDIFYNLEYWVMSMLSMLSNNNMKYIAPKLQLSNYDGIYHIKGHVVYNSFAL